MVKKATISKTNGKSLCVIFRHPVRKDKKGKSGLRIRRGLGTPDQAEAEQLVGQMNEILADESFWKPTARSNAEKRFDPRIVAAFYDNLEPTTSNGRELRESLLPLPKTEQGYKVVLIVGTTGAGKTTLLRQLLGTHPTKERFPSTSTAKTTTADIELILDDRTNFKAVVTFLSKDTARQLIADCVAAATMANVEEKHAKEISRKLLEHREQKFRLSYLLGAFEQPSSEEDEDEDDFDDESETGISEIPDEERKANYQKIEEYLDRIKFLAREAQAELETQLEFDASEASLGDRDAFEELLHEHLETIEDFQLIVDDILGDCENRFELLESGKLSRGSDNWPQFWSVESKNREEFISAANRFSSNTASLFGRLLTPLVEGLRVRGPFFPEWYGGDTPRLVFLDGQGLGHTPTSASSVSTRITKQYERADSILLVDSATQPMQAAPITVLRSIVSSGHESKLSLAFTHMDEVKGVNMPSSAAKRDHVQSSVDNAFADIGKTHGHLAKSSLEAAIVDRTFFLGKLHEVLGKKSGGTKRQLVELVEQLCTQGRQLSASDYAPAYALANLVLSVQQAMSEFRDPWRARLKLTSSSSVNAEHWTRVKALTRHISQLGADEYDGLQPVADFIATLQNYIARFLAAPIRWDPCEPATEQFAAEATALVRQTVFQRLHKLAHDRLIDDRLSSWSHAFSAHRGTGSTYVRARDIEAIFANAAPIPSGIAEKVSTEFLNEIRKLVGKAIEDCGGKLVAE